MNMVTIITNDEMEPIKEHPRYRQRVGLILTAAVASIFCIISIIDAYWDKAPWIVQFIAVS